MFAIMKYSMAFADIFLRMSAYKGITEVALVENARLKIMNISFFGNILRYDRIMKGASICPKRALATDTIPVELEILKMYLNRKPNIFAIIGTICKCVKIAKNADINIIIGKACKAKINVLLPGLRSNGGFPPPK